jgi:hypothetical protein
MEDLVDYELVFESVDNLTQSLILLPLFENGLLERLNDFFLA